MKVNYLPFYLLLIIAGCTSTGLDRNPQSVEENLYVYSGYGLALTQSVNEAYATRTITKVQQLEALDALSTAKDVVQSGLDAYSLGNYDDAQTALDRAEAYLRTASLLLARYAQE